MTDPAHPTVESLAAALQDARLELVRARNETNEALGEVGQAISSRLDIEKLLKTVITHAVGLAGLGGGVSYEYEVGCERFEVRAWENLDARTVAGH